MITKEDRIKAMVELSDMKYLSNNAAELRKSYGQYIQAGFSREEAFELIKNNGRL